MDRAAIRTEIKELVRDGLRLRRREVIAAASDDERTNYLAGLAEGPEKTELAKKPYFVGEYQNWYSPALRVVEQLLPDRYEEFRGLYKNERRKTLDLETFGIADYISGIQPVVGFSATTAATCAMNCFERQISIVRTAEKRLDSLLTDIGRTLHAEIFDNELDAAKGLLTASHVRSAGVVAGVVLEGHLKKLIADHKITFRRTATLSNLNDALKAAGVYDAPQWRRIQYLTDIRNLCGHKSDRDPDRSEVETLIIEVSKLVKNLF